MRDHDVLRDLLIHRRDVVVARPIMENADHRWMRTVNRAENPSFSPTVVADIDHLNQHPVPMHRRTYCMRWNKNVSGKAGFQRRTSRGNLRNHKPEAVAVHSESADDQVLVRSRLRNRIPVGVNLKQLPTGDQPLQPFMQLPSLVSV